MAPTTGTLLQMIQQNDEKHEEGHRRLREDYRSLERKITSLETAKVATDLHLARIDSTPVDVTKLSFTPRTIIAIVIAAVSVAAGQWVLRADVLKAIEINAKAQDERIGALRESIESMKRRQELQQYEIQGLKEAILKQGGKRP